MEKITQKHLLDFLSSNILISSRQNGFMPGRSISLQLLRNMDDWTEKQDNGNEVDLVYINFQKAFDSVPHQRLFGTIAYYRNQGKSHQWSQDILFGRKQRVVINESSPKGASVGSGFPQGSVVGPLLFIKFVNSMFNCVSSKIYLYAGDARKCRAVKNIEDEAQFKNNFNKLWNWTQGSFLRFNFSNCHQLTITLRSKRTARSYILDNDKSLTSVEYQKELGVGVDSTMSFYEHIASKLEKANRLVAILKKRFLNINKDLLRTLHKAIVRRRLEYANQIWSPHLEKHKILFDNTHL